MLQVTGPLLHLPSQEKNFNSNVTSAANEWGGNYAHALAL